MGRRGGSQRVDDGSLRCDCDTVDAGGALAAKKTLPATTGSGATRRATPRTSVLCQSPTLTVVPPYQIQNPHRSRVPEFQILDEQGEVVRTTAGVDPPPCW